MEIKQGDVFLADFTTEIRPVLVVSNNIMNKFAPLVIVTVITTGIKEPKLPTHVKLRSAQNDLIKNGIILLEQVRTLDKGRLSEKIHSLSNEQMIEVSQAWSLITMLDENEFKLYEFVNEKFVLDHEVKFEEDYEYEFKEIPINIEPWEIIKEKILPYVAAFLNDNGGRILFGIRDNDKVVTGIKMPTETRDDLRLNINNKILDSIQPKISPAAYSLRFHEVYGEKGDIILDMYVLEINVHPPVNPTIVYFLKGSKIYSKVNGGKHPLEFSAIQDFIQRKSLRK
jgi:mRNA-degrading endonuclease toxin of MazEF toxin-antitoxin module